MGSSEPTPLLLTQRARQSAIFVRLILSTHSKQALRGTQMTAPEDDCLA